MIERLQSRGVKVMDPASTYVAPDVDPERIHPSVRLYPGCRILGPATCLGPGCVLGEEAPATVDDCQFERKVAFKGGYAKDATFLAGAGMGSGAHVRTGCLLEEQASCGHTVGIKQTILFPFVTLGSLVNFCDCLMSGGTGRANHGEVGSSYVHFNFTPHQDKATASLIGNVPRGVMLDQPPVFLGGQGGLVGPARIDFGTVIAAGTVFRGETAEPGRLVFGQAGRTRAAVPYDPRQYGSIERIVEMNLRYIGNLHALLQWYRRVRLPLAAKDPWKTHAYEGAVGRIDQAIRERVRRLGELARKLPETLRIAAEELGRDLNEPPYAVQRRFADTWPTLAGVLEDPALGDAVAGEHAGAIRALRDRVVGPDYLAAVRALPDTVRAEGSAWLQAVVACAAGAFAAPAA
jgi:UDP-N-acetylglucosamine/UDP-N-acetylgalactosamine diphosphorylase